MKIPTKRRSSTQFLRTAVAHRRSSVTDTILGLVLSFVAGGINAGGFLAVGQYTSHMTGIVSAVADNLALGVFGLASYGVVSIGAFIAGAASSAILINWGRRNIRTRQYAYPIAAEAVLLLVFGLLGIFARDASPFIPLAVLLLCFIMGLQNATITKISGARMRTTHLTGMITDIGIELGKHAFWHRDGSKSETLRVRADLKKLRLLSAVVTMFFLGGVVGALGFGHLGFGFSIPLAGILMLLATPSLFGAPVVGRRDAS